MRLKLTTFTLARCSTTRKRPPPVYHGGPKANKQAFNSAQTDILRTRLCGARSGAPQLRSLLLGWDFIESPLRLAGHVALPCSTSLYQVSPTMPCILLVYFSEAKFVCDEIFPECSFYPASHDDCDGAATRGGRPRLTFANQVSLKVTWNPRICIT